MSGNPANFDGPQPFNVDMSAAEIADQTGAKSLAPPPPVVPYEIMPVGEIGIEPVMYRDTRGAAPSLIPPYPIPPSGLVDAEPDLYGPRRHGVLVRRTRR